MRVRAARFKTNVRTGPESSDNRNELNVLDAQLMVGVRPRDATDPADGHLVGTIDYYLGRGPEGDLPGGIRISERRERPDTLVIDDQIGVAYLAQVGIKLLNGFIHQRNEVGVRLAHDEALSIALACPCAGRIVGCIVYSEAEKIPNRLQTWKAGIAPDHGRICHLYRSFCFFEGRAPGNFRETWVRIA